MLHLLMKSHCIDFKKIEGRNSYERALFQGNFTFSRTNFLGISPPGGNIRGGRISCETGAKYLYDFTCTLFLMLHFVYFGSLLGIKQSCD